MKTKLRNTKDNFFTKNKFKLKPYLLKNKSNIVFKNNSIYSCFFTDF